MSRRAARAAIIGCGLALGGATAPSALAQTTTLTITGGSASTFAQPALTDYVAGFIDGPTINFTVDLAGGPPPKTHTVTVEICATTATLGGSKAISKLMWEPTDLSKPWQSMTTGCTGAVQATRTVATAVLGKGGSFSGAVKLRMILDWTDTAASYGTTIAMTVNVSTP